MQVVGDLDALSEATFVVEAIVEETATRRPRCSRELAPDRARRRGHRQHDLLAVGRASSPQASGRPDRFVGLHVFNPVPKMKLVELAFPEQRQRRRPASARFALCEHLGKTPVEVPDVPGFVVNRLLFPYLFSAVRLQEETGLSSEAIDQCMKLGAGHPMGPLALLDFVGLDVAEAIGEAIGDRDPRARARARGRGRAGQEVRARLLRLQQVTPLA